MKESLYSVPKSKQIRVIIDSDCDCEADDQYAIAHALMTPKFDVIGIIAAHFGKKESEEKSYREIHKILELMDLQGKIKVLHGCQESLPDEENYIASEGSQFIVEEARKEDSRPLFVVCQGAITNLANAYLMDSRIAERLTAIWIGGGNYPEGGWEFNLFNDINAANVVMDSSIELWQVPMKAYSLMKVSFSVLFEKVYPCGNIGKYLVENLMRVNEEVGKESLDDLDGIFGDIKMSQGAKAAFYPGGESWQLGDSPVVGLMLLDHHGHYELQGAPRFNQDGTYLLRDDNTHKIRVYHYVDSNFILNDFYSKLKYYYGV
ncbi:MAG: hypothetical protein K0S04_3874 [Herbinix sp.]|jgi:hypothetical protein|nr:hypothetical protein [Herbinix sp.]